MALYPTYMPTTPYLDHYRGLESYTAPPVRPCKSLMSASQINLSLLETNRIRAAAINGLLTYGTSLPPHKVHRGMGIN